MRSAPSVCSGIAGLFLILISAGTGAAQESLADLPSYRDGCQALADERFETAVEHFSATWDTLVSSESGDTEKDFVASRILQSFFKNDDAKGAVDWLRRNPFQAPSPETLHWVALAYQTEEHFAEAITVYKKLVSELAPPPGEILLNFAICLTNQGSVQQAFEITEELPGWESTSANLARAQIAGLAGKHQTALALSNSISSRTDLLPEEVKRISKIRIYSLAQIKDFKGAASHALTLINSATEPEEILQAFLLLESIFPTGIKMPDLPGLESILSDEDHPAQETALLFQKILEAPGNPETGELEALRKTLTSPLLLAELDYRLGEMSLSVTSEAPPSKEMTPNLEELRDLQVFRTSAKRYRTENYEDAATDLLTRAENSTKTTRRVNLHNAAVAALRSDNIEQFEAIRKELQMDSPKSPLLSDLSYLSGLYFASKGNPQAFGLLTSFVQNNENHSSFVDAQLALAEIHVNQAPARPGEAREIFELLETRPLNISQNERLDYIKVWAGFTDRQTSDFAATAEKFLSDWPNSAYYPEVALILAKRYFETKNYASAKEWFRLITERFPDSSFAETARFFAAKSSSRDASTVKLWKELIDRDGSTKQQARHELALLHLAMDEFSEARAELSSLLEEENLPKELKLAATADLGFSWYAEALSKDKEKGLLEEAADAFAKLASDPEATKFWRFNAAVRRGKCLESLGSYTPALEIYRSIVEETTEGNLLLTDVLTPKEMNWVFRAGFSAIDILKSQENWSSAIEVADALASKEGTRAFEAARLSRSLRLKHWVWD